MNTWSLAANYRFAGVPAGLRPKEPDRLDLAHWLVDPRHPLTARVAVNHVWKQFFGRGLVATPDNFGASGATPSHPALLDHLAVTFADGGWSVKKLIRTIVLSHAYRLSSQFGEKNFDADPDNVSETMRG